MPFKSETSKYKAVVARDKEADSHFFYGVKTTKIFCRPSCSSREPKRENVLFFFTCKEAQDANFRPCKRCHPEKLDKQYHITKAIIKACRFIEDDPNTSLEEIAKKAGFSPFHFHRLFKRQLGLTPNSIPLNARLNSTENL